MTIDDVAAELKVTRRSVERLVANQQIGIVRVGRAIRVTRDQLDEYVEWSTSKPKRAPVDVSAPNPTFRPRLQVVRPVRGRKRAG